MSNSPAGSSLGVEPRPSVFVLACSAAACAPLQEVFRKGLLHVETCAYHDGEALIAYLHDRPRHHAHVVLLDLDLGDALDVLARLKADPQLRRIPLVVIGPDEDPDVAGACYDAGVNAYISKPLDPERLRHVVRAIGEFWFQLVHVPKEV